MRISMNHAVALLIACVGSCGVGRADAPKMDKLTPAGKFTGPLELGLPGIIGVVLPEKYITDAPTQAGSIRGRLTTPAMCQPLGD